MVRVGDDSFVVALGYASDGSLLGDVMSVKVDGDCAVWETLSTGGSMARRWASYWATRDGKLLVWGGWNESGPLADCALFDPLRRSWSPLIALAGRPRARRWAACDTMDGRLVVAGGYTGDSTPLDDAFAVDVVAGKAEALVWKLPRSRHTLCNGLLMGGYGPKDAIQRQVFRADTAGECWLNRRRTSARERDMQHARWTSVGQHWWEDSKARKSPD